MKIKTRAHVYLALAVLMGALVPIMLDLGTNISTAEFVFLVYLVSAVASLAFVFATGRQDRLVGCLRDRAGLARIALIGVLNYAFFEYGVAYAEQFVSASLATAVYRSYPVLMLLFLPYFLREQVTKRQLVALSLGFIGIIIALTGGGAAFLNGASMGMVLLLVFIALMSALSSVLVKKYVFDIASGMFIFAVANLALFSVVYAASGFPSAPLTQQDILAVLYIGVVYNVLLGVAYYSALRALKTTFVTNVYLLSPFITFLFADFVLGEQLSAYYVLIALFVAAGMLVQGPSSKGGAYMHSRLRKHSTVIFDVTSAFVETGESAIAAPIRGGGKVLAVKVDAEDAAHVERLVAASGKRRDYVLYTDSHRLVSPNETEFVRDITSAQPNEIVFMCAGKPEHGEAAVEELLNSIEGAGLNPHPENQ